VSSLQWLEIVADVNCGFVDEVFALANLIATSSSCVFSAYGTERGRPIRNELNGGCHA
jgi:hypothetical protein